jgi:hypothetical protein
MNTKKFFKFFKMSFERSAVREGTLGCKKEKAKLVTHSYNFHIDDIFSCAALSLLLEKKKN